MREIRKLSVVIAAFNEAAQIEELLRRVTDVQLECGVRKEIVVVDDGSTDGTGTIVERFAATHPDLEIRCLSNGVNRGKGASLQSALRVATGDVLIVQDADLEYDPQDYNRLLESMRRQQADVVYGSRFIRGQRVTTALHRFTNWALTCFSNLCTGLQLVDVHTCLKLFRTDLLRVLRLEEKRFGFCPEVTAKLARLPGIHLIETPVSYRPRRSRDGKKIGVRDGLRAIWCSLRYSGWGSRPGRPGTKALSARPAGVWRVRAVVGGFLFAYLLGVTLALWAWPDLNRRNFYAMLQHWPRSGGPTFGSHFATWDSAHYLFLSEVGYRKGSASCAFYPLFPAIVQGVSFLTGSHVVAGLLCANACLFAALMLCHELVAMRFDSQTANWTIAFLCAFPGSLFFHFIYTESLFLLLLVWLCLAVEKGRYALALLPACLLPVTRAVGVFAALPLLWHAWSKRQVPAGWALALTPLAGAAIYLVWMKCLTGNAWEGWVAQRHWPANSVWHLLDPLGFIRRFAEVQCLHCYDGSMLDRAWFFLAMCTLPSLWRSDREWFWWAVVLALVPGVISSFVSFTRYCAVAFPCFVVLACRLRPCRPTTCHWPILGALGVLHGWLLWRHVNFVWAG